MQTLNMGTVNVSMSDPPSCMAPNGSSTSFTHVFITVRSVQAHIDPRADDNSSNWQELAPQLATTGIGKPAGGELSTNPAAAGFQ